MKSRALVFVIVDVFLGIIVFLGFYVLASNQTIFSDSYKFYLYYFGLMLAGAASLIFAFVLRFPLEVESKYENASKEELARAFRIAGLTATARSNAITIVFNSWNGVVLKDDDKSPRHYYFRLDATSSSMAIILMIFLFGFTAALAIPFSAYTIYRTLGKADYYLPWVLRGGYERAHEETVYGSDEQEIRERLLDSLSEANRLAEEAYRSANSAYGDMVILVIAVVGIIGGLILFILISQTDIFPVSLRAVLSLLLGMAISWVACAYLLRAISKRMRPQVLQLSDWVRRLSAALRRERSSQTEAQGESAIELLFEAYHELPNWLKARRKATLLRNPASYVLMWLLTIWAASLFIAAISGFTIDFISGLIPFLIALAMSLAAFLLYRNSLKQADQESKIIKQEWEKRRLDLIRSIEENLGGM